MQLRSSTWRRRRSSHTPTHWTATWAVIAPLAATGVWWLSHTFFFIILQGFPSTIWPTYLKRIHPQLLDHRHQVLLIDKTRITSQFQSVAVVHSTIRMHCLQHSCWPKNGLFVNASSHPVHQEMLWDISYALVISTIPIHFGTSTLRD